jgi:hypothetical protein
MQADSLVRQPGELGRSRLDEWCADSEQLPPSGAASARNRTEHCTNGKRFDP